MTKTANFQYASPVYGNTAREFGAMPQPAYERYAEPELLYPPRYIPAPGRTEEEVITDVRTKQAISPFTVIGSLIVGLLLVFSLLAQTRLNAVADDSAKFQRQIRTLETDRTRLLIEYECAFNFSEIEAYAINTLGMQKPTEGQIHYLQMSVPDKAVILNPSENQGSLIDRVSDTLASLGEYLK